MTKPRIIAFYLPQFHPFPENDLWWGKGFTEWTNVGKAKPLFPFHKQPNVPTELGYYDLRIPQVREEQARLAKEAGIEGFCYWHYYFGNGKQLMQDIIEEVVKTKKPDFPFCLGWANEPWEKKMWNKDGKGNELLMPQLYEGDEDYINHFYTILPILKDSRYIKVDGKPLFFIYKPYKFDDLKHFIELWRELAKKEGLSDIHFVAHARGYTDSLEDYIKSGCDAVYTNRVQDGIYQRDFISRIIRKICKFLLIPELATFKKIRKYALNNEDTKENYYPGIICGWDHTPRSGRKGKVFTMFSKDVFKEHIKDIVNLVKDKETEHQIIFLKSWNEWGEGNFMEPDLRFGKMKIEAMKEALQEFENDK